MLIASTIAYVIVGALALVWGVRIQVNSFGAEDRATELMGLALTFGLFAAVLGVGCLVF